MPTQTGFWIQVKNGEVKQVWDYAPDASRQAAEGGWREDLTADPAQIVWAKRELTVDERKGGLEAQAKATYQSVVEAEMRKEMDEFPETQYDAAVVSAAQDTFEARMNAIAAATTHEDVDAL